MKSTKMGKRGTVVIPATLRKRFGMDEGSPIIAEETDSGVLLRPAVVVPIEIYSPERKAEFLLSNAVDKEDYASAKKAVREMGLDPKNIPHRKLKKIS